MKQLITTMILVLILSSPLYADEITLINGDHLTGTIERYENNILTFASDLAGTVDVDAADIKMILIDEPIEVHYSDGTVGETAEIVLSEIIAINPTPVDEGPAWTGNIFVSGTTTMGNTESENAGVDIKLDRDLSDGGISTKANYLFARQEDDEGEKNTTSDSWAFSGKYEADFSDESYGYIGASYKQDRIADLDLRSIYSAGYGHKFADTDAFKFSIETGAAWLAENYSEGDDKSDFTLEIEYSIDKKMGDNFRLLHETSYYPVFDDLGDYFLTSVAEFRSSLTSRMYASLKIILDYDSTPADDKEETDMKFILGFGYNLD